MKKLIAFVLLMSCLVSFPVSAATRLKGKSADELVKFIGFVDGTGEKTQIISNKLKVTALELMCDWDEEYTLGIRPRVDPNCHVYYYKTRGGLLLANMSFDDIYGVKGLKIRLENISENAMSINWNESAIQIGNSSSVPFIDHQYINNEGKRAKTSDTVIAPNSAVEVKVISSANLKNEGVDRIINPIVPISDDGSSRVNITMKVMEDGAEKYYSYQSPCIDFPAAFLAEHRYDKKKK